MKTIGWVLRNENFQSMIERLEDEEGFVPARFTQSFETITPAPHSPGFNHRLEPDSPLSNQRRYIKTLLAVHASVKEVRSRVSLAALVGTANVIGNIVFSWIDKAMDA
jgi:hypothetical protein